MKKVLFSILALGLLTGCSINIDMGKDEEKENNQQVENNGKQEQAIDYNNFIMNGTTIAKVDEKEITLNGNKHKLALVYSYETKKIEDLGYDYDAYAYYLTILYDGKTTIITNLQMDTQSVEAGMITNFEKYVKLSTLKDTSVNKDYLSISIEYMKHGSSVLHSYAVILDEIGKSIYEYEKSNCYEVFRSNGQKISYVTQEQDSLVVLNVMPVNNLDSKEFATASQTKVMIKNGKLNYTIVEFTEKLDFAGGC